MRKRGGESGGGTKLNPDTQKEICEALEIAVPFKYAAEAAGVSEQQAYEWIRRGNAGESPYDAFALAVTRAKAIAVRSLTQRALLGEKGSQQATWFLERRFRDEYGPARATDQGGPAAEVRIVVEGGLPKPEASS